MLKRMTKERRIEILNMTVLNGGTRDELLMHLSAAYQEIDNLKEKINEYSSTGS